MATELTAEQKFRVYHFSELAKLIKAFKEVYGDEAYGIVAKQRGEQAFNEWKEIAAGRDSHTIEDLIELLWEPMKKEGFEYEVSETEAGVHVKCTRCGFHDLAQYVGITEEAYYMACESDPYILEGFNPNIGLKRTKTLMQGFDCCDFLYYMKQ